MKQVCLNCGNKYKKKKHYQAQLCDECQFLLYALNKELSFPYTKKFENYREYNGKTIILDEEKVV